MTGERFPIAAAQTCAHTGHGREEILDHAVGVRVIGIEAIDFAFGGEVYAGLPLDIENDARGIGARLLAGQRGKPIWHWI